MTTDGDDSEHVRMGIIKAEIAFGEHRKMLNNSKLPRGFKVAIYKGAVLAKATFGCEVIDMTARTRRRFKGFNARCLSVISGRSISRRLVLLRSTCSRGFDGAEWHGWEKD